MTSEQDFLQAILSDPDADAPRLVFADWLEERGDSDRAEFIRLQCELARLPRLGRPSVQAGGMVRRPCHNRSRWDNVDPDDFIKDTGQQFDIQKPGNQ